MSNILTNRWFKLGCVLFVYLLWTLWIGSWWLLLGVPVLFDIYITKKVHWAFWKKKGVEKQTKAVEWIDALIFAIIAARHCQYRSLITRYLLLNRPRLIPT